MHTLTTQEPLENSPAIVFRMMMHVESDARQETKVSSGHTSTTQAIMWCYKYNSPSANVGNGRSKWIRGETAYVSHTSIKEDH